MAVLESPADHMHEWDLDPKTGEYKCRKCPARATLKDLMRKPRKLILAPG